MSRTRHRLGKVLLLASALTACGGSGPTGPGRLPEGLPADHPALEGVGGPAPAPAPDTVLAEVNGHAITSADLDVALAAMPGEDRLEYTTPEMLTELVESLVDRHLQAEAAKAAGLPAEDWLVRELGRVPAPTPDEIAVHYAAHRDEFRVPARVLVTRVRVASRDGAERARVDLEAGVPFSGLLARTEETGLAVDQDRQQAVVAFDNCWHLREMVEKKQYEKELAVAADIQQGLFPARLPDLPGFDISAMNRPAQQVGGDYYDVLTLTDHGADACLFCVADVSGKGLAASLLMSTIQATLRALLGREPSLSALAARTSDLLFATTPGSKYATAALVLADTASGECRYVSGGHTETLLLRASGERTWFGATGVPLGLFPDMAWDQVTFTLQPGDVLVLYSDGVSEAQTATFDEFGPERLADIVDRQRWRPAQEITAAILAAIDAFVEGAPQFDDITLMVIKRE